MLLLLLWRHADYYINGVEAESRAPVDGPSSKPNPANGANPEPDPSQAARPTDPSESRSGWGISLFSPFRRKAEPAGPRGTAGSGGTIGVPLASSTLGTGSGSYGQKTAGGGGGLGRSVLTVSALGSGGRRMVGGRGGIEWGEEADVFKASLRAVLEPIFERLGSLQLVS